MGAVIFNTQHSAGTIHYTNILKFRKITMEGCYKVEENINFESFLRVMGVTEDEQIQRMMAATKEVTLTNNGDGTWTQVSGLKTSTFPIGQEYTDTWGDKQLTGLVTMEAGTMRKVYKLGDTEVLTEEVVLAGAELTVTLVARDGTKAVRRLSKM